MGCIGTIIRVPLGVVLGYAAMAIIITIGFAVAFLALGAESVYAPESWEPSRLWLGIDVGLALVAAYFGGVVATMIGRRRAGLLLAFIVAIAGIVMATVAAGSLEDFKDRPAVPTADMSFIDSGKWTEMPGWLPWAHAGIGFVGVLIGTSRAGRRATND